MLDLESLHAKSQAALIDFLSIDLNLAFTFCQTALIERTSDHAHYMAALGKAETALQAVRHFEGWVDDLATCKRIHNRADELEREIAAIRNLASPLRLSRGSGVIWYIEMPVGLMS